MSVHRSSHFKGLYDTKEIPHLVLKMADNYFFNLYFHHILKDGGNHFPYFNYDEKNQILDLIKADASVSTAGDVRQLMEINTDTKSRRGVFNQAQPDMTVCSVRF